MEPSVEIALEPGSKIAEYGNHQASADAWYAAMDNVTMDTLRPEYGDFYGFEASVPHQIRLVRKAIEG